MSLENELQTKMSTEILMQDWLSPYGAPYRVKYCTEWLHELAM